MSRREGLRRRRRIQVLMWSAVVWVPVLCGGVILTADAVRANRAIDDYGAGHLESAADDFEYLADSMPAEPWKGWFNLGTALTALAAQQAPADAWAAIDALDEALDLAPEDEYCTVQRNRAVAFEVAGDAEMARSAERAEWAEQAAAAEEAGEDPPDDAPWVTSTAKDLMDEAIAAATSAVSRYENAQEARTDPRCPAESPEEQAQEQEAQERLEDKEQDAREAAGEQPDPEPQPDPGSSGDPDELEDALRDRNEDAAADAEAERQEGGWWDSDILSGGDGW